MPITIGTQLGYHEITGLLGKGGMGEVYRARDTKLKREVAIKILPDEFARDPDRITRFQREAELLAALNHPNIGAIYDLQEVGDSRFLVLELVEGTTLADRLIRGPIPIDEALRIGTHVCEALEAAHEKGVIHRDLKPGNVKITPDGNVKVLDFGLAKALESSPASGTMSNSPTLTRVGTNAGVILGTAGYMSPEQARGRAADQRSDVFSFGCVLYEMLSGRRAFEGDEVSDVLASVLKSEADFSLLPANLNPRIREVLRRCLQKNPKLRWQAIGDTRIEIEAALADPSGVIQAPITAAHKAPLWRRAIPVVAAIILTAAFAGFTGWLLKPSPPMNVTRFSLMLGEGQRFTSLRYATQVSISPDGTQIVYEANHQLYHRLLSEPEARPIPGTQTTQLLLSPVFSPDGRSVAYITAAPTDNALKAIAVTGGPAMTICQRCIRGNVGFTWSEDGILLGGTEGILRVYQGREKPETLLSLKSGEFASGPQMLPGGEAVLFTLAKGGQAPDPDSARIVVQSLKSAEPQTLIDHGTDARYTPTGHIIYAWGGILYAVALDTRKLKLMGEPVRVVEGVRHSTVTAVEYSFSNSGTLIYVPGPVSTTVEQMVLALVDPQGSVELFKVPSRPYAFPRVSPDGKRVAFEIDEGKQSNIWIYELGGTQAPRQLTVGGANHFPVWSADGTRVAFQSDREGDLGIFWQRADGGAAERLTKPEQGVAHIPDSASKDGNLSFTVVKGSEASVWILSLKDKKPAVFAQAPSAFIARSDFSPDGCWIAYQSNEAPTGRNRLWVQPFPSTGAKYPIVEGGQPFWSKNGNELFFNAGPGGLISKVNITTRPNFAFSDVIPVTQGPFVNASSARFPGNADTTPDGKLIGLIPAETSPAGSPFGPQIQVVQNWFTELRKLVPAN